MWRPDDWEKHRNLSDKELNTENYLDNVFEAGADAMLEALFKLAKESPTGKFEIDSHTVNIYCEED